MPTVKSKVRPAAFNPTHFDRRGNSYVLKRMAACLQPAPESPPEAVRPSEGGWVRGVAPGPGEPFDVLLPLGHGSKFEDFELRIALRSIEKNLRGYRVIWVVGHDPGFLKKDHDRLVHVPMPDVTGNHEYRIAMKLTKSFQQVEGMAPHVLLWNDDYVVWREKHAGDTPFFHKGELAAGQSPADRGRYNLALAATRDALRAAGLPDLNYDIHVPMFYERDRFLSLGHWFQASGSTHHGLVVKSMYANNFLPEPGSQLVDCKLKKFDPGTIEGRTAGRWVFSYSDAALQQGLKRWLERAFPVKSSFERGDTV